MSIQETGLLIPGGQKLEVLAPKRVIRVPNNFGLNTSMGGALFGGSDVTLEGKILDTFNQAGYSTLREGDLDYTNPEELGFHLLSRRENPLFYSRSRRFAQEAGALLPNDYKYTAILGVKEPIVAKHLGSNRGDGKYLLDSPEYKARFLAWMMIDHAWNIWRLIETPESYADIKNILRQIQEGNFSNNILLNFGKL